MNTQAMKQAIRQSIIAARLKIPGAERARLSAAIAQRIGTLEPYRAAHTVLGYMSFGAEFGTDAWVRQVLRDGKALLLPRVNAASRELDLYRVTDVDTQLAPGAYDIREPQPERCEPAGLDEADFMLLPGVAFGRDGSRLGYGGGFYDKLLARMTHRPTLAAAAFAMQVVEDIPLEATDRKVEWLVTENETIKCAATGER